MKTQKHFMKSVFKRSVVAIFCSLVIMPLGISIFYSTPAYAANSNKDLDMKRRKLWTLHQCIKAIEVGIYIDSYATLSSQLEKDSIVVGLDRETNDGVMTCKEVVASAVEVYAPGVASINPWLLEQLTGKKDFRSGDNAKIDGARVAKLDADVLKQFSAIESPDRSLVRKRIVPLANVCYNIKSSAGASGYDFKVPGVGYFYQKSNSDIKDYMQSNLHVKTNGGIGTMTHVELGSIALGFFWVDNGLGPSYQFSSDFYPVGSDIKETKGYLHDAIVDCGVVSKYKDWLFDGYSLKNGKLVDAENNVVVDPAGDGTTGNDGLKCESGGFWGLFTLNWLVCPIITGMETAIKAFDNMITNLLTVNTNSLMQTDCDKNTKNCETANGFYKAWSGFRIIAMSLLVLVALVMIISTAIGSGPFDAYTIRKVLPRILIAVLFIALSWPLMKFAIDLSNGAGQAVRGLIYGPFSEINSSYDAKDGLGLALLATGAGSIFVLGPIGVLTFALTALIGVLTAIVVLVFREMLIVFLVILAPVAIVAYILPNTQRAWKMWSDYFLRALLLFPLFAGFVSIGRAFAQVAASVYPNTLGTIVALIAYFGPYFMLPKLFQMSGGAIAAIGGAAVGATAGMRSGLSKYRANKRAENMQKLQAGTRFSDRNKLTRGINSASAGIGTGLSGGFGLNKKGRAKVEMLRNASQAERMKQPGMQDALYDDDVRFAVMHGNARDAQQAIRDRLNQKVASGKMTQAEADESLNTTMGMAKAIGFDRSSQLAAFNFEAANKSRNFKTNQDMSDMLDVVSQNTGVNRERLAQSYAYAAGTQGGRLDLRAESLDEVLEKKFDTRLMQQTTATGWEAITTRNLDLLSTGTDEQRKRAGAQLIAMQESLPGTSEESRQTFIKIMEGAGIDFKDGSRSVENQLARKTQITDPLHGGVMTIDQAAAYFRNTSSTYGSADRQWQANQQNPGQGQGQGQASDARLKCNVRALDEKVIGHGINYYEFEYVWSSEKFVGVMAQEVLQAAPEAISFDDFGFMYVDYAKIGAKMYTLEEWDRTRNNGDI